MISMRAAMMGCGMAVCLAAGLLAAGPEAAGGEYGVARTMHIGGAGGWDYVTADGATQRIFVPRSTHTQVIEAATGKVIEDIADTPGCHGVALAPDVKRGFISDSKGVTVFDTGTLKVLGIIAAGTGPDAVIYDPASKCVVVMNGRSKDASFIEAGAEIATAKATTVALGGKPEFAAADGKGRVYINIEDTNEVAVVDTKTFKVVERWKIEKGEEPTGMAIDTAKHRLYVGCHNQTMAVIDTESGKTVANVAIGSGVDACEFDAATGEALASCGDGTLSVIRENGAGKFAATVVKTRPGARTMGLDASTHTIYLAAAEMDAAPAEAAGSAPAARRRPTMKPESFMLVVVSRTKAGTK